MFLDSKAAFLIVAKQFHQLETLYPEWSVSSQKPH
jgi:hypothetical protein